MDSSALFFTKTNSFPCGFSVKPSTAKNSQEIICLSINPLDCRTPVGNNERDTTLHACLVYSRDAKISF